MDIVANILKFKPSLSNRLERLASLARIADTFTDHKWYCAVIMDAQLGVCTCRFNNAKAKFKRGTKMVAEATEVTPDLVREVLKQFDPTICYVRHERDCEVLWFSPCLCGAEAARGRYLNFATVILQTLND